MAADDRLIGIGRCAIGCGSTKARYTLSKSNLPVCTCNACHSQTFARSDTSDGILRANIAPAADPAPPAPAPGEPPAATPAPTPAPAKRTIGWGVLAGKEV